MVPPRPRNAALFLDLDGTLVDIAARPGDVRVDEALRRQMMRLAARLGGAVAVLTGRSLDDLDRLLHPLELPAAGLHGAERRSSGGGVGRLGVDPDALTDARDALGGLARAHAGLLLEDKGLALAIHYRLAPEMENFVDSAVAALAARHPDALLVQKGLLVREIKPAGADKGRALRAFMEEPPFAGRVPIALGDDVTDTDAFDAATSMGGFGVAVGSRISARWTLAGPRAVRSWLATFA